MKILIIGRDSPDSVADNVGHTLRKLGHEVQMAEPPGLRRGPRKMRNAWNLLTENAPALDARQQVGLVRAAASFGPDLTLAFKSRLRPSTVRGIAALGSKTALWFPDHVANMGKHEMFLAGYDRIYLKNPCLVDQLGRVYGLPVRYLPEAANPDWHRPIGEYGTERTIVLAGNIHPARSLLLERLLDAGIPLTLHGGPIASWIPAPRLRRIHTGRSVGREDKARVFRGARAVLNNLHPGEVAGSNCRLYEAAASGAVVLTEVRAGMEDQFGTEVLGFRSFDELLVHCRRLLDDASYGAAIADSAARRASADHTYAQRLGHMLVDLGLE